MTDSTDGENDSPVGTQVSPFISRRQNISHGMMYRYDDALDPFAVFQAWKIFDCQLAMILALV